MVWVLGGIDAITQNYARHGLIMPCFEFWGLDCLKILHIRELRYRV